MNVKDFIKNLNFREIFDVFDIVFLVSCLIFASLFYMRHKQKESNYKADPLIDLNGLLSGKSKTN